MKGRAKNIFWGLCFLLAGVGLLGDWFAWWGGFSFGELLLQCWWALLLLLLGISSLLESVNAGSLILTLVGAASMAYCLLKDAEAFRLIFPGAAIIIGLCLIFGKRKKPEAPVQETGTAAAPEGEYTACFSGRNVNLRNAELNGGFKAAAVFGGLDIDLCGAVIREDITLRLTAVFGGIDVFAPESVNIKTTGSSFLGGCENKTAQQQGRPTVTVEYSCVFGGIEIK